MVETQISTERVARVVYKRGMQSDKACLLFGPYDTRLATVSSTGGSSWTGGLGCGIKYLPVFGQATYKTGHEVFVEEDCYS